jgi:phthalate 4,5-cis-dihydrodiol dehydrogenase
VIRVGIVGCGYIGNKRAQEIAVSYQSKVCVVCDTDEAKAKALALKHNAQWCLDWKKVVNDPSIDAVVVAVSTSFARNL